MRHVKAIACFSLFALSLLAIPQRATAVEADISGTITGGLEFDQLYSPYSGYSGYAYGRGMLPHLGKTGLYAPFLMSWPWDSPIASIELGVIPLRFSAANGDYLYAECGPMLLDEVTGTLSWALTFSGGTGRFTEASGTATLVFYVAPEIWLDGGYGYMGWGGDFDLIEATLNY